MKILTKTQADAFRIRFRNQLGSVLAPKSAPKICENPLNARSKMSLKMLHFWNRFFIDLGCLLALNLGPTWTSRWLWSCPRAAREEPTDHPRGLLEPRTTQKPPRTLQNLPREVPTPPLSLDFGPFWQGFNQHFRQFFQVFGG